MTSLTESTLADGLQMLVDARLETIERMLVGRMRRSDRVAIVREVESQILELIAERGDPDRLTREDVLDVLGRLDPPEAYLPEDDDAPPRVALQTEPRRPAVAPTSPRRAAESEGSFPIGKLGGLIGIASLAILLVFPLVVLLGFQLESEMLMLVGLGLFGLLGLFGSIAGLVLSIRGLRQGAMAIVGIVTSGIAIPIHFLCLAYLLVVLLVS